MRHDFRYLTEYDPHLSLPFSPPNWPSRQKTTRLSIASLLLLLQRALRRLSQPDPLHPEAPVDVPVLPDLVVLEVVLHMQHRHLQEPWHAVLKENDVPHRHLPVLSHALPVGAVDWPVLHCAPVGVPCGPRYDSPVPRRSVHCDSLGPLRWLDSSRLILVDEMQGELLRYALPFDCARVEWHYAVESHAQAERCVHPFHVGSYSSLLLTQQLVAGPHFAL